MIRLARYFEEEHLFYRVLLLIGGITAILKGLRMPYVWAATQAQIDYRYGLLRRGLFGEICRQLRIPIWRYGVFSLVSFIVLGCLFLSLARCIKASGIDKAGLGSFSALIAGSFCITMLVNLVGFYDVLLPLLVILIFRVQRTTNKLIVTGVIGLSGVLIHDIYAVAFLPVSLLESVCRAGNDKKRWVAMGVITLLPLLIILWMTRTPQMNPAQLNGFVANVKARTNFVIYPPALMVLEASQVSNLKMMLDIMRAGEWWIEEFFGLLAFLPTTLFFVFVGRQMTNSPLIRRFALFCTFSPLLLNFIGFDRYRWLTLMELNSILCAIAISGFSNWEHRTIPVFSLIWRRVAVLLLLINLNTDIGFFIGHAANFPFQDHWISYRSSKPAPRGQLLTPR